MIRLTEANGRAHGVVLVWLSALVLGLALRAVPVTAARPYIAYVDEGHFLHPAFRMIRDRAWDPRQFAYPQLPRIVVAAAGCLVDWLYVATGRPSPREQIPSRFEMYDDLEPFAFLATARVLSVVVGLGIVMLTGFFAERLAGPVAGAAAAIVAACTPALVMRGSIASADSYAALTALAALFVTDLSRTCRMPVLAAFAAGGLAGAAFASKYPAVLVFVALVVTTLFLPLKPWVKVCRLSAGIAGVVVGAFVGMPVLWQHAAEIRTVLLGHWSIYNVPIADGSLWRQSLVQAESNLQYEGPELGVAFCLLALVGIVVGARRRELLPTIAGWCAFAAVMFLLFASRAFRPFRNLLPLVPIGCVAVGMGYVWLRRRARRPAFDAAAVAMLVLLFVLPMASHARRRLELRDPRRLAVDWLAANAKPTDTVVVARELAILEDELARVHARTLPSSWNETPDRVRQEAPRLVVAGVLTRPDHSPEAAAAWPELSNYRAVFQAGVTPTPPFPTWWRGNDQIVVVFERKAPG